MGEIKTMKKKGTILYIGGFELPDKNAAAHRVLNNGKLLRKLGYNVVFLGVTKKKVKNEYSRVEEFDVWSMEYPKNKKEWFNYLISIKNLKEILKKYDDIKMIIAYNYQSVALFRLKKYCQKFQIKLIADCTEWYDVSKENKIFYIIKSLDSYLRMKIIHPKLDGIIVISSYLEEYYRSKHMKKISNLPPLIDKEEIKWKSNENIKKDEKINLIYSGNLGMNKDKLNYIIEGLKNIDDKKYIFKVLGLTKQQYLEIYPEQEYLVEKLKENIVFLGRLEHLEALDLLKKSDFMIFVRDITRMTLAGFPTKFVESLSCGIPVITNSSSDIDKYLINDKNGFLISENYGEEIKKILKKDTEYLKKIKSNIDKNKFDYNNYIEEIKKIF